MKIFGYEIGFSIKKIPNKPRYYFRVYRATGNELRLDVVMIPAGGEPAFRARAASSPWIETSEFVAMHQLWWYRSNA